MESPTLNIPPDPNTITADDLAAWLDHIRCAYTTDSRLLPWYVKAYRVADKIKRAKLNGDWPHIIKAQSDKRTRNAANLAAALDALKTTPPTPQKRLRLVSNPKPANRD